MPHRHCLAASLLALLTLAAAQAPARAGYTTDPNATGAGLVEALLAPSSGITVDVASIVTIGAARQNGRLLSFDLPQHPLPAGIGLSTGTIVSPTEPRYGNNVSTGSGAHAGIAAARGWPTVDQGVLRFSFTAKTGMPFISGLMVFGSDEYPGSLNNPDYGDGLLILVDGVDVAALNGQAFSLATVHQRFGLSADSVGAGATGWNGLSPLLRFTAALDPLRSVHQIEFAVADIGDSLLDSALFVSALQGLEPGPATPGLALAVPEPGAWALLMAGLAGLAARRRHARRGREWAAATVLALAATASQAALHDRGNGLIYDDVLDLTWLQDSNFSAQQQPQDHGYMSYWQAKDYVSSLGIDLADGRSVFHWRLPQFRPVNGLAFDTRVSNDGSTDVAYNIGAPGSAHAGMIASELAYMFHINLGNKSYCDVNGLCPQPGWGLQNPGPFINFDTALPGAGQLWAEPAGMPLPPDADVAWSYQIQYGAQALELDAFSGRARVWAVHDGDIAAVPEPGVWMLMLSGLAWVGGRARRRTPGKPQPA